MEFYVTNAQGLKLLYVRWTNRGWEVSRFRINGTDAPNMGRVWSDTQLGAILRFYAEAGDRVKWEVVKKEIAKWEKIV